MSSKHYAAASVIRHSKLSTGRLLDNLPMGLLALDRKQYGTVTRLLNVHYTLRQCLHIMGISKVPSVGRILLPYTLSMSYIG
jgi:hypothetical protein